MIPWETQLAAARRRRDRARRRRDRARRNPWNQLLHWVHARRHRELHQAACTCGGRGR